jgi:xanthine dehydrogenase iron-sulfur cluster and FAD-binding subunit A
LHRIENERSLLYINYTVTLTAAPAKLQAALPKFAALVKSIQLRQPE